MKKTSFVAFLLLLSFNASGEMYRWVDAQGSVHYTDEPPPAGAKSSKTFTPPAASPAAGVEPAKSKSWQEKEIEFQKRKADKAESEEKKAKEEADARAKKDNCEQSRKRLQALESGQRFVNTNEKGEREVMEDAARQKALADARKAVADWCK